MRARSIDEEDRTNRVGVTAADDCHNRAYGPKAILKKPSSLLTISPWIVQKGKNQYRNGSRGNTLFC